MTNILIPTDFTANSIKLAEQFLQSTDVKAANIIFFHAFNMPDSAFDLLDRGRKMPYADVLTDSFRQQCKQLKDQYNGTVQKVCFKFMEGNGSGLFRNFADANEIDIIFCPEHYHYSSVNNLSIDPRPLFKKSGVKVIKDVAAKRKEVVQEMPQMVAPTAALIPAH